MSSSKNYSELLEAWTNWRDASGKPIRKKFITYFQLGNKAAKMNELPNKSKLDTTIHRDNHQAHFRVQHTGRPMDARLGVQRYQRTGGETVAAVEAFLRKGACLCQDETGE